MPNTNPLTTVSAPMLQVPPSDEGASTTLAEISRKWLADIDPQDFEECHTYLIAIRRARQMRKVDVCRASQTDGTAASGISLPTISKIERGAYGEPGFRTMVRLARGYGIPLSNLQRYFD